MKKKLKTNKKIEPSFHNPIFLLDIKIRSLIKTLPLLNSSLNAVINKQTKDLELFTKELKNTEKKTRTDEAKIVFVKKMSRIIKDTMSIIMVPKYLKESYLNLLVIEFENSLAELIRAMYYTNPVLLESSDKNISYVDLMRFKSISESKKYIVDKEVEDILRKNILDIFKWIEVKAGIEIIEKIDNWYELVEVFERRNIIVHNNGFVNEQYLRNCKKNGKKEPSVKVGKRLAVTDKYFQSSCETVLEIGIILVQLVSRKLDKDDYKMADIQLEQMSFELLENENYKLAIKIFDFALKYYRKPSTEAFKMRLLINKATAYKFSGNKDMCQQILESEDWTAKGDEYQLAVLVLKEKYKEASDLMYKISTDKVTKNNYQQWPLFKDFRKSKEFLNAYNGIYKENFTKPEQFPERIDELIKELKNAKNN